MSKRKYQNNQSTIRRDGKIAFSPQGRAIADRRTDAKKLSRIQEVLGKGEAFTDEFKAAFDPGTEHEQILDRVHLVTELDAAKKTMTALRVLDDDNDAQRILEQMRAKPTYRKKDYPLCPIWRHERETRLTLSAVSRYVFPRVTEQLYLVTIVYDFAENLLQLEEALKVAHKSMTSAVAHMGKKRRGVVMAGTFEFDLMSYDQLVTDYKSKSLMNELGITATESGGWTLTGHFFVRVPHRDVLEDWLRKKFPSSSNNWARVRFDQIKKEKDLLEQVSRTLSYSGKMPKPLFNAPTRKTKGNERQAANELMRRMSAAFNGAFGNLVVDQEAFDLNAAIAQWAKFIDRIGPKLMYYSVESTHAQKWYSESEMDYIRMTDSDLRADGDERGDDKMSDGEHLIEVHRDQGPFPPHKILPHLQGRMRDLRSRQLTYDAEWETMTDCSGINIDTEYHDFDWWTVKP